MKKTNEYKSNGDTNCGWFTQYSHEEIDKGAGGFGNKSAIGNHPIDSIIKTRQNSKNNLGDIRRLTVTQNLMETLS